MKCFIAYVKLVFTISLLFCQCSSQSYFPVLKGPYLGQKPPGIKPTAFLPEIFSPGGIFNYHLHTSLYFSPEGKELYFTNQKRPVVPGYDSSIFFMKRVNDSWTKPKTCAFSTKYTENAFGFSPDGNRLYFDSTRPLEGNGEAKDSDIWFVERTEKELWGDPLNLGPPVNSENYEGSPVITAGGHLFFAFDSNHEINNADIYRSEYIDGNYSEPVRLKELINTHAFEKPVVIAPDESYLIFYRWDKNDRSQLGLYVCFKNKRASWSTPKKIENVSNKGRPFDASLSPNGKYLFILQRNDNLYWVDAKIIEEFKPDELK